MKDKRTIYLLIGCVAAVWGVIFFKVYANASADDEVKFMPVKGKKTGYFNLVDHRYDQLDSISNYRDPFVFKQVGNEEEDLIPDGELPKIALPLVIPVKPIVNWSGIFYKGYIRNPLSKEKVVLIVVNGQEAMLQEGQSFSGLKLIRYAGDSIQVLYQQSTKYILIQ